VTVGVVDHLQRRAHPLRKREERDARSDRVASSAADSNP